MQRIIKVGLIKISVYIVLCFLANLSCPQTASAETEDAIGGAQNGIVEIMSGFFDKEGTFHKLKSASGFLISNAEGRTYIVTNNSVIRNSDKEKEVYCSANQIDTDNYAMTDGIRIIVKGDVSVEAVVLTRSTELDFCILSVENVVNEKASLKLGDHTLLASGDTVYALGFPDADCLEYTAADVEILQGNVQDKSASQSGKTYIQHSAAIADGNTGGPLLDADGYVVGINCREYSDAGSDRYYSLPINELTEVLDNFAIVYGSRERDELLDGLVQLQNECLTLCESGEYKKDSLVNLQDAVSETAAILESERPSIEEMENALQNLTSSKELLLPKTEKILIVIYSLSGLILLCLLYMIWILILLKKNKKNSVTAEKSKTAEELPANAGAETVRHEEIQEEMQQSVRHEEIKEEMQQPVRHEEIREETQQAAEDENEKTVGLNSYQRNRYVQPENSRKFLSRTSDLEITRIRTGQTARVDKPEYLIGKSPEQVEYFVSDNKTVSRKHSCISWKHDAYFICDLGSANGTCLNGKELTEGISVKLSDGDMMLLSDEEFKVKISQRKE